MNILHISNGFAKSDLYTQLVCHLDLRGISQTVYSAVRTLAEAEFNPNALRHIQLHLRFILKLQDRLFYRSKIKKIYKDLTSNVEVSKMDVIHAYTLYSDGGVALQLKTKYKRPYIVAVRNTDINAFMRYRPDLNALRDQILENASQIVMLSPAYYERLRIRLRSDVWKNIRTKVVIVPNGISPSWFEVDGGATRESSLKLRLLYVGDFSKNKNIHALIKATHHLSSRVDVSLTLAGGGGDSHNRIISILDSGKYPFLKYVGRVNELGRLKAIYRENDIFVMPSFHESFGLVYIEALSQGMPIVFSRCEGVDGYFEDGTVGEAVDPSDVEDITAKIEKLSKRMNKVREQCIEQSRNFDWSLIAQRYHRIYESILSDDERDI